MSDSHFNLRMSPSGQVMPPETQAYDAAAFEAAQGTVLRWLGQSGLHINSRGIHIMVDPVLEDFDLPLLIAPPLTSATIPYLDALLITHDDGDHFSETFLESTKGRVGAYHGPRFVADLMTEKGLAAEAHEIGDKFTVGETIEVQLTPAWHNWKSEVPKYARHYALEDYCGFYIHTPDGKIWIPGDSKALPQHYEQEAPDVIFFDWSDNYWHIGFKNAVKLANTYPKADLICQHWGSVDAPTWDTFNLDPRELLGLVVNPERIRVLAAGEPFVLERKEP